MNKTLKQALIEISQERENLEEIKIKSNEDLLLKFLSDINLQNEEIIVLLTNISDKSEERKAILKNIECNTAVC